MKQGTVSVRLPVVVGGSVFIDCVCKAVRGGINQLEQCCGEANIIKMWSHAGADVEKYFVGGIAKITYRTRDKFAINTEA